MKLKNTLLSLALLLNTWVWATPSQWAQEALSNIMHVPDNNLTQYFSNIEKYFTPEAFSAYKTQFNKTNTPLIEALNLTMTSSPTTKLQPAQDNPLQLRGSYTLLFNSNDLSLTQDLEVHLLLTQANENLQIKSLQFSKLSKVAIKMKRAEMLSKCLKDK